MEAISGSHEALEKLLELYAPLIDNCHFWGFFSWHEVA